MNKTVHLYIVETNTDRAANLTNELAPISSVTVTASYADAVSQSGGLDAIFVPLMSAMEWGAIKPPAPLHQTAVIEMPEYEVAKGRPQFAIPGVATEPGESLDPVATTRLVLRASFSAIDHFNQTSQTKLRAIGAASLSLGLDKLQPGEALALLKEV